MTTKLTAAAIILALGFSVTTTVHAGPKGNGNGNHAFRAQGNFKQGNFGQSNFRQGNFGNQFVHQNSGFNQNFNKVQFHSPNHNFQNSNHNSFFRNVSIARPQFQRNFAFNNYHLTHARKYDFGYCYIGNQHQHWASTSFYQPLGCNVYFDSCTDAWYYWCTPHNCYYPVSYCPFGTYTF